MKKLIAVLFYVAVCLFPDSSLFAQTLSPFATPVCGGYLTNGNNSLSFTMGETLNTTLQNGNLVLTQGEQQPYLTLTLLNLKAFIQGYYSGAETMKPVLLNAGLSNDPNICDSITIELHDQFDPSIIVTTKATLLHTNGWAQLRFPASLSGGHFYIVIKSRNTIETWSKSPVVFTANTTFKFTN